MATDKTTSPRELEWLRRTRDLSVPRPDDRARACQAPALQPQEFTESTEMVTLCDLCDLWGKKDQRGLRFPTDLATGSP